MDVRMDPRHGKQPEAAPAGRAGQRPPARVAGVDHPETAEPDQPAEIRIEHFHLDIRIALTTETTTYSPQGRPVAPGMSRDEALRAIREWIRSLFEQQGLLSGGVEEQTPEEAAQAVGAGGYFSAEETAKRIVDFARAVSNGDQKLATTIRDAFEEGFRQAEGAFGSKLPDVSYRTRDLVRQGLDELFGPAEADRSGQVGVGEGGKT